ncbi:hypothetical protein D1604_14615 [Brevundimonas sp. LPMIX5]|nr:hypothetical protein D1604_14615 [Brevundimonas sp. LPMIX5]
MSCGVCGGPMIRSGADQRFVCSWRRERSASICSNGRGAKGAEIERGCWQRSRRNFCRPSASP